MRDAELDGGGERWMGDAAVTVVGQKRGAENSTQIEMILFFHKHAAALSSSKSLVGRSWPWEPDAKLVRKRLTDGGGGG